MLKIQDLSKKRIKDLQTALTAHNMEVDHIEKSANGSALLLTRDLSHGNRDEFVISLHHGYYCTVYLPVSNDLDESQDAQTFHDDSLAGAVLSAFRFADAYRVNEIG